MKAEAFRDQITEDMEEFFSHCVSAHVEYTFGSLGGCKHYEAKAYPARFRQHIDDYVKTDKTACRCFTDYLYSNHYLAR